MGRFINAQSMILLGCSLFVLYLAGVPLVMLLYARLFSDKKAPAQIQAAQTSTLGATPARNSLPPPINIPIPGRQQVRTNELAQPPSVTEHTTRLLDNE